MKSMLAIALLVSFFAFADEKVDLQFAIEGPEEAILKALELRRRDVIEREIFLFDTAELDLYNMRIQVRLRFENDEAELGVKRWGLDEATFPRLREMFGPQCETDVHGDNLVRSCAVKKTMPAKKAKDLLKNGLKLLNFLNREQIALLFEGGSPSLVTLRGVQPLGPIASRVWEWYDSTGSKFVIDMQTLADEQRFVELSLKTKTEDISKRREDLENDLRGKGLILPSNQEGRRPQKLNGLLRCQKALKP